MEPVWKIMGCLGSQIPGKHVEYLGGLVWRVDVMAQGADLARPTQGAIKKEIQAKLAQALIQTGQMLLEVGAGFDEETAPVARTSGDRPAPPQAFPQKEPAAPPQAAAKAASEEDEEDPIIAAMIREHIEKGGLL